MHRAFGNTRFLNKITNKSVLEVMAPLTQYLSDSTQGIRHLKKYPLSDALQVCKCAPSIADYFSLHFLTFRRNVYIHAAQNFSPLKRTGNKKNSYRQILSLTRRLRILATSALLPSCLLAYLCAFIGTVPHG